MENPTSYSEVANNFLKLLSNTLGVWTEPAKTLRNAKAEEEASRIKTAAEIERDAALGAAKHRMQILEIMRQKNLESIAALVAKQNKPNMKIEDQDWLIEFIESAKDTSDPTIQDIWAKLLTGEMDSPGSCSKRTLRMVKALSGTEAKLINETSRRVCVVHTDREEDVAFVNVFVKRVEKEHEDPKPRMIDVFEDDPPDRRKRDRILTDCGFLSDEDYKFTFQGEGSVSERYELSHFSARKISMGSKAIEASKNQPRLIFSLRKFRTDVPSFRESGATIEFDAWRLTPTGHELVRAINVSSDYEFLCKLRDALETGGLSTTLIDV
jgi:hypothetical protein